MREDDAATRSGMEPEVGDSETLYTDFRFRLGVTAVETINESMNLLVNMDSNHLLSSLNLCGLAGSSLCVELSPSRGSEKEPHSTLNRSLVVPVYGHKMAIEHD